MSTVSPVTESRKSPKKFKEIDQGFVGGFIIGLVIGRSTMVDPVVAVADSLQALRNGTTDDQWTSSRPIHW